MKKMENRCRTNDVFPKQVTWSLLCLQGLIFLFVSFISLKNFYQKKKDPKWIKKKWYKKIIEYKI